MLGWMDDEALHRTMTSGRVTFFSRSRQEYWRKGDTSGHVQWVKSLAMDCDGDALLVRVDQVGAACHTGTRTCFDGRELDAVVGHGRLSAPAEAEPASALHSFTNRTPHRIPTDPVQVHLRTGGKHSHAGPWNHQPRPRGVP